MPDAQQTLDFNYKLRPMQPGIWTLDATNRTEVWEKLKGMAVVGEM